MMSRYQPKPDLTAANPEWLRFGDDRIGSNRGLDDRLLLWAAVIDACIETHPDAYHAFDTLH